MGRIDALYTTKYIDVQGPGVGSRRVSPGDRRLEAVLLRFLSHRTRRRERSHATASERERLAQIMIIHCSKLTTCDAVGNGETVKLDLLDEGGRPISLRLSFEHAESIAMTLPRLLTQAVKAQTGQDSARYVFPLGQWFLEGIKDHRSFILTLKTVDGFEVSFRVPPDTCRALGWTLAHEADNEAEADNTETRS